MYTVCVCHCVLTTLGSRSFDDNKVKAYSRADRRTYNSRRQLVIQMNYYHVLADKLYKDNKKILEIKHYILDENHTTCRNAVKHYEYIIGKPW